MIILYVFAFALFVLAVTNIVQDVTNKVRTISAGLAFWVLTYIVPELRKIL